MRRFFVDRELIHSDRPILIGRDVKHIRTVLRLKPGDEITLFDGEGSEYCARIIGSTPRAITLFVLHQHPAISESPVEITIGQALIKARKMDRIVRQLTELGTYAFIPFMAERSVPRPEPGRLVQKKAALGAHRQRGSQTMRPIPYTISSPCCFLQGIG